MSSNYLEYRINNKVVRYDILRKPLKHTPYLMLTRRILEKPPSYISCHTVDRFRRKAPRVVRGVLTDVLFKYHKGARSFPIGARSAR